MQPPKLAHMYPVCDGMLAARSGEPHLEDESDVVDVVVPMFHVEELRGRGASGRTLFI